MSEPTDNARLVAEGVVIELANGASAALVIDARAVWAIEDRYGSLQDYYEALGAGPKGKLFGLLAFTFRAAGLAESEDAALDLVDPRRAIEYLDAIGEAMAQAMPPEPKGKSPGNGRAARRGRSRGAAISGSPSRSGTSPRTPSGE